MWTSSCAEQLVALSFVSTMSAHRNGWFKFSTTICRIRSVPQFARRNRSVNQCPINHGCSCLTACLSNCGVAEFTANSHLWVGLFLGYFMDPQCHAHGVWTVSYTHLRAHETPEHLVCRLLLEKKKKQSLQI
eukprot:TRINITY_DN60918_c0_g1_i1.p2 TRINITY_DN60918_c0_g1~~TRINITY_DN60918_c0_g1_i1.p2  ORF type:complete len:132 (-),score=12.17 TRINITY_DN60918_c0_g1_i1:73-468(-)